VQLWLKAVRDCICHQLLPDCPVLGEPPHKVPLASLELVEGVVDKVCNLGCRKFVVTFPTLFYWLSIVPLIPWLHALLKRWCCEEDFDFLSRLVPDEPAQPAPGVRPPTGMGLQQATANVALSLPLLATSPQFATSLSTLKDYADRFAGSRIIDVTSRVVDAQIRSSDLATVNVTGKSTDLARQDLAIRGVKVAQVIDLDQSALPRDFDLVDAAFTPLSLTKGDEVVLVTRGGQALFHVIRRQPVAGIGPDGKILDLTDVSVELDSLARRKEEIAATREIEERLKGLSEDRAAVGAELDSLKSEVARLKEEQSSVKAAAEAEQARLDQLAAQGAALAKESQLLVKDIEDTDARLQEVLKKTRAERPVETLTADKEIVNQLIRLGLETVSAVASIDDPNKLVGGPINLTTARGLIRDAQRRVKG
jgi:hypothetical protein